MKFNGIIIGVHLNGMMACYLYIFVLRSRLFENVIVMMTERTFVRLLKQRKRAKVGLLAEVLVQ
jgi:hypothetical protein